MLGVVAAAIVLLVIFRSGSGGGTKGSSRGGGGRYQVGQPAKGELAPAIQLSSTSGDTFDLAGERGKTVLLYFHEGLGCQPCWDQIRDLERSGDLLRRLGIDEMVAITTNPLDLLREKADPELDVSRAYRANEYGMMGTSRDGHTFIVVGPDGRIRFRADYGGAPKYTMYVNPQQLEKDLRAGLAS
jgi:peroxiredoxin